MAIARSPPGRAPAGSDDGLLRDQPLGISVRVITVCKTSRSPAPPTWSSCWTRPHPTSLVLGKTIKRRMQHVINRVSVGDMTRSLVNRERVLSIRGSTSRHVNTVVGPEIPTAAAGRPAAGGRAGPSFSVDEMSRLKR